MQPVFRRGAPDGPSQLRRVVSILASYGRPGACDVAKPVDPSERKERTEALPKRLEGIDVVEHLNTELPKHVEFTDEHGRRVKLGDYFDGKVPVIVTLNYSGCPMLCSLILNGLVEGLKHVDWTAARTSARHGQHDPAETPEISCHGALRRLLRPAGTKRVGTSYGSPATSARSPKRGVQYGYNENARNRAPSASSATPGGPSPATSTYRVSHDDLN